MRQCIDDGFLYKAMPAAEADMLSAIPPEDELKHTFSRRFERKMQALLRYERRSPAARTAARLGKTVAAVLAAALLLNTALVGGVKAYREGFYEIIETVTRKYTAFSVKAEENTPPTEFTPIEPPYVPEGYEVAERQIIGDMGQMIHYCNDEEKAILFTQMLVSESPTYFDTEDAKVEILQLYGCEVYVISEDMMTQTYWVDGGHEFAVSGNAGYEEILKVTEKILEIFEK